MQIQIERLRLRHAEHMVEYVDGNDRRLAGKENTA
eukprot:CAMPEP_0115159042 /NCGR_PEP_ID=MMETSP0227-20121206/69956_1 /TAXON_ID=89957 /ORGANISM="Polarella glacialis, Strain CCMP 1383" /LENGTH=34 /DNA_ID= /DNA_START= /DNA_END= /DNA_ORIENTATION=